MKHVVVIGIVLVAALAAIAFSQGKRAECLHGCRVDGDYCAEKAYRAHAECTAGKTVCGVEKTAALRKCQKSYDACRYACDLPRF